MLYFLPSLCVLHFYINVLLDSAVLIKFDKKNQIQTTFLEYFIV